MDILRIRYPLDKHHAASNKTVIAIGDFDGVHLGHREVIGQAVRRAREVGADSAIMTFHPHPREVLGQSKYSRYLAPFSHKMRLLEQLGVDRVYVVEFDEAFAAVSPELFVDNMLMPLRPDTVIVGFDFTFGHRGMGTAETLRRLAAGRFRVEVVSPYNLQGEKVSSTYIREQLHLGRPDRVRDYLGRPYSFVGQVVHGEGRGRTIGFPTANIEVTEPYVIPRNGVYLVRVHGKERPLYGVMNIGVKPTFHEDGAQVTLEAHLFDFDGDLYGSELMVDVLRFLRAEERFASVDELVAQIRKDVETGKRLASESASDAS